MLRRIMRVGHFRAFKDWRSSSSDLQYERVNLVYGVNGSGKSTLAALLHEAARGKASASGLVVEVDDGNGGTRPVSSDNDAFWQKVRVFNREYVERTLRFDHEDGTSHAPPLLVLGERQVDADEKISQHAERLREIDVAVPQRDKQLGKDTTARSNLLSGCARHVVEDLQQLGGRYKGTNIYTQKQVRDVLTGDRGVLRGRSENIEDDLATVRAVRMEPLPELTPRLLHLEDHEQRVNLLLKQTVTSQALDELKDNPVGAEWAQRGIALHEDHSACLFCGGALTDERRQELDRHFDDSLKTLQASIQEAIRSLKSADGEAATLVDRLPKSKEFYESLREQYSQATDELVRQIRGYRQRVGTLLKELDVKLGNLFTELPALESSTGISVNLAPVVELLREHNKRTAAFDTKQSAAAKRVEYARVDDIRDEYDRLTKAMGEAERLNKDEKAERERLQREIKQLNRQSEDPLPLAEELTRDLARLLGRDELVFRVEDHRYAIERNGAPALALSEGERTAISLLYFLCSLREHSAQSDELVVVIDDPVSSLDGGVLVGASAHLWSELVNRHPEHQVIVLTHNFELFRIWSNQLDRAERFRLKSLVQEIRMKARSGSNGQPLRTPVFRSLPNDKFRKRIRSQYHYLFWTVARALCECTDEPDMVKEAEAVAVIPNVARKMLEAFLSFKYPDQVGDFEGSVKAAISGMSDPMRQRVVRFLHHHSHNEEGDIGKGVDPSEAVAVLSSVFELIRYVDENHYLAMCAALNIEPDSLRTAGWSAGRIVTT